MSKTKKNTFNMIAADIKNEATTTSVVLDGKNAQYEIIVKNTLDFENAMKFVGDIVGSCIDNESMSFTPEGFDFSVRVNALIYYAGFDVPSDIEKAYDVAYRTNLFDEIMAVINREQCSSLIKAARERIAFERDILIREKTSGYTAILKIINDVLGELNNAVDQINSSEFGDKVKDLLQIAQINNLDGNEKGAESKIVAFPQGDGVE